MMISWWRRDVNIRSDKEFDPSDKLSLSYFSITTTNKKEIRMSKNKLKNISDDIIMTSSPIKN